MTDINPNAKLALPHQPKDDILTELLDKNAAWSAKVTAEDPDFFTESAKDQRPKVLWIGCSDSRVPESVILDSMPGVIFTHRNIANQVHLHDDSVQSVLVYAITQLNVEHVIVCGHTHCGGVGVCIDGESHAKTKCFPLREDREYHPTEPQHATKWPPPEPLDRWLHDLRKVAVDGGLTVEQLTIENVRIQVENVIRSPVVRRAWAHLGPSHLLGVHGWLYNLETGLVKDLHLTHYGPEPKHWSHPAWKGRRFDLRKGEEPVPIGAPELGRLPVL